jgi:hypothetical protein
MRANSHTTTATRAVSRVSENPISSPPHIHHKLGHSTHTLYTYMAMCVCVCIYVASSADVARR